MANTRRFKQLLLRIGMIEKSFMPTAHPTGNFSNQDQDNLRAYLLLVHAELESYFEEISENKAKTAFKNWKTSRTKSNVLIALVSFCDQHPIEFDLEVRVNKALTSYIHKLKKNNGIKEKNLLDILLPIGIEQSKIDSTWLSTMTSFGTNRGEVAHSTATVQQPLDPVSLKNTMTLILKEISKLDGIIRAIR